MNIIYNNNFTDKLSKDYNNLTGRMSAQILVYF
jgi:hypothetical protein